MIFAKEQDYNFTNSCEIDSNLLTLVIPAAGKGTRLKHHKPKILFEVGSKSILMRLTEAASLYCCKTIVVASPDGKLLIEDELKKYDTRSEIVIQESQIGMGDSIMQAIPSIKTELTLIIWGDQYIIDPNIVTKTIMTLQQNPETSLVLPITSTTNQYIHLQVSDDGRLIKILQKREGDILPVNCISDCGIFGIKTKELTKCFTPTINPKCVGKITKEVNFIPVFPELDTGEKSIIGIQVDPDSSIGINSPEDALRALEILTNEKN